MVWPTSFSSPRLRVLPPGRWPGTLLSGSCLRPQAQRKPSSSTSAGAQGCSRLLATSFSWGAWNFELSGNSNESFSMSQPARPKPELNFQSFLWTGGFWKTSGWKQKTSGTASTKYTPPLPPLPEGERIWGNPQPDRIKNNTKPHL